MCRQAVCFDESVKTVRDTPTHRRWPLVPLVVLKRTFCISKWWKRKMQPREVGLSLSGKVNATKRCRIQPWMSFAKKSALYLSYAPPAYEYGTRPIFLWVRSQGLSPYATGSSKNASGQVGIPLFGAPQTPGDKPNHSEEGLKPVGTIPWGQRYIQWWNTLERTVQHATMAGRERPTNWTKCTALKEGVLCLSYAPPAYKAVF